MSEKKGKILYITTKLPFPIIGGDKVVMYNSLKQLKNRGYDITLVSLATSDDDLELIKQHSEFYTRLITVKFSKTVAYLNAVKAVFNDKPFIVQYFYNSKMQKIIDNLIKSEHFDIITGYMIRIAPYLEKYKTDNILINYVDAVSMMYERRVKTVRSLWDKLKIGIEYLKVKNYEKKCARLSKKQTTISKYDKAYLESFIDNSDINVIGMGVNTDFYKLEEHNARNNISFVGSMQYIPNSEAAMYFGKEIFPLIKKEIPDAKFKIIGAKPRQELFEMAKNIDGIEITGRVDDVREYMKDCSVSVCPVQIAGGVQTKVLEAMSMGIPVVTTPGGAEGIGADENILLVAKNNEEFAEKVINLMKNKELNKEISIKSRDFIVNNFSWDKVGNDWDNVLQEVIA